MMEQVSVVGLDVVGVGLALTCAKAGIRTIAVDTREERVMCLQGGETPMVEPGYRDGLGAVAGLLSATTDMEAAIRDTTVSFILAATPDHAPAEMVSRAVEAAARDAGRALRLSGKPYHLFVVSSALPPGATERRIIPAIEETSGRRLNRGFAVCYAPVDATPGSVLHDLAHPDLILVGETSAEGGQCVAALHTRVASSRPAISRMSIASAEVAKVSISAFVALKVAFANTVANLCEAIPDADVDQITRAIGADRRVSPHGLTGGLPPGGPGVQHGTHAFGAVCQEHGEDGSLVAAAALANEWQHARLAGTVLAMAGPNARVAILGLACQTGTPVIDGSTGARLAAALTAAGRHVQVFDRLAGAEDVRRVCGGGVQVVADARGVMTGADVVVLAVPDPSYLAAIEAWRPSTPAILMDCCRVLEDRVLDGVVSRVVLGRGGRTADPWARAA